MNLDIVIPVYRSEDCLRELLAQIAAALEQSTGIDWTVILVDDCSPDKSWQVIRELQTEYPIKAIRHRRNFGQDAAIMTGLRHSSSEIVAVMDDDLQHDPKDLPRLIEELGRGYDLVFADFPRKHQAWWKNVGSFLNGRVAEFMINKPRNIYLSPYKVFCGAVSREIIKYTGPAPYVDGLLLQATSGISQIESQHRRRFSGESNYTVLKSFRVASRLAFAFSVVPLRVCVSISVLVWIASVAFAVVVVILRVLYPVHFGDFATGWASLIVCNLILGGMQIAILGVVGEYVGRTLMAVNNVPQSVVAESVDCIVTRDKARY